MPEVFENVFVPSDTVGGYSVLGWKHLCSEFWRCCSIACLLTGSCWEGESHSNFYFFVCKWFFFSLKAFKILSLSQCVEISQLCALARLCFKPLGWVFGGPFYSGSLCLSVWGIFLHRFFGDFFRLCFPSSLWHSYSPDPGLPGLVLWVFIFCLLSGEFTKFYFPIFPLLFKYSCYYIFKCQFLVLYFFSTVSFLILWVGYLLFLEMLV